MTLIFSTGTTDDIHRTFGGDIEGCVFAGNSSHILKDRVAAFVSVSEQPKTHTGGEGRTRQSSERGITSAGHEQEWTKCKRVIAWDWN